MTPHRASACIIRFGRRRFLPPPSGFKRPLIRRFAPPSPPLARGRRIVTSPRLALLGFLATGALALAQPAFAEKGQPYFGPEAVDLSVLLVPPPASGSTAARAELDELKALQAAASEDRKQRAIADAERNYQRFAATTSLAAVDAARLPLTVALIQRVLDTVEAVTAPAKRFFNRPRPPLEDPTITPLIKLPDSPAYPSGHATPRGMEAMPSRPLRVGQTPPKKSSQCQSAAGPCTSGFLDRN